MSDDPAAEWAEDPEKTHIPVRGDCGHIYVVPLARLQDGADFHCSVCGQADRFDEAALQSARDELAEMSKKGPLDKFAAGVSAFLAPRGKAGADKN